MKIVSINSEQTVSNDQVAFNLDENLSPELLQQLEYGSLSFQGNGNVLIVTLDPEDNEPIDPHTVASINERLAAAVEALNTAASQRRRMIATIARNAGLPLE